MKTLAVFGASGKTGRFVVEQALKKGYAVRALVRDPSRVAKSGPQFQVIQGDATNSANVEETIKGSDAVISVIGGAKNSPPDIKLLSAKYILAAMSKQGVKRFLRLASAPLGVPGEGDRASLGQKLMAGMIKSMMKAMVEDELKSAELIRSSAVEWTLVRAPMLNDNPGKSDCKVGALGSVGNKVSRETVAIFMLNEVEKGQYMRKSPLVSD
jgi:putative NADH-flavin reductase